jgi:hypothetical protein
MVAAFSNQMFAFGFRKVVVVELAHAVRQSHRDCCTMSSFVFSRYSSERFMKWWRVARPVESGGSTNRLNEIVSRCPFFVFCFSLFRKLVRSEIVEIRDRSLSDGRKPFFGQLGDKHARRSKQKSLKTRAALRQALRNRAMKIREK